MLIVKNLFRFVLLVLFAICVCAALWAKHDYEDVFRPADVESVFGSNPKVEQVDFDDLMGLSLKGEFYDVSEYRISKSFVDSMAQFGFSHLPKAPSDLPCKDTLIIGHWRKMPLLKADAEAINVLLNEMTLEESDCGKRLIERKDAGETCYYAYICCNYSLYFYCLFPGDGALLLVRKRT
jgi:hypothetical protein